MRYVSFSGELYPIEKEEENGIIVCDTYNEDLIFIFKRDCVKDKSGNWHTDMVVVEKNN